MEALDEDTKETIIRNVGELYPNVSDRSLFWQIFDSENWDLEKSVATIKSLLEYVEKDQAVSSAGPSPKNVTALKTNVKGEIPKSVSTNTNFSAGSSITKPPKYSEAMLKTNMGTEEKKKAVGSKASRKEQIVKAYNEIQKMDNPIHRITISVLENIRVMVIMRGCPGSGKTFLVQQLSNNLSREQSKAQGSSHVSPVDHHIFSADDFWVNPKTEKYVFNAEYIECAHRWNQKLVRQAASEGRSPIFVDNTHTRLWEMQAVATIAVEFGYIIEIIESPNKWRFNVDELVRRNSHGVHREAIKRMVERYERHIKPSNLISSYGLQYPPNLQPPQRCLVTFNTPPSKNQMKIFGGRFHCVPLAQVLALKTEGSESSASSGDQARAGDLKRKPPIMSEPPQLHDPFRSEIVLQAISADFAAVGSRSTAHQTCFPQQKSLREPKPDITDSLLVLKNDATRNMPLGLLPQPEGGLRSKNIDPTIGRIESQSRLVEECDRLVDMKPSPMQPMVEKAGLPSEETSYDLQSSAANRRLVSSYESSISGCDEAYSDESPIDSDDTDSCEKLEPPSQACDEFGERLTSEYVIVGPDEKLTFQRGHTNDPYFLNEFKRTSHMLTVRNKLEVAKRLKNLFGNRLTSKPSSEMGKASTCITESLVRNLSDDELALPRRNTNATDLANVTKSVSFPGATTINNEEPTIESVQGVSKVKPPGAPFWDSLKITQVDHKNIAIQGNRSESESNTNYKDFETLTRVNAGDGVNPNSVVLVGNAFSFISATPQPKPEIIKRVATHDKSSMTVSELSSTVEKDSGIEILTKMFPDVSVDCLVDLFEKCHKDLDWTVNQMMDAGLEVSADFIADNSARLESYAAAQNSSSTGIEYSEDVSVQASSSAPPPQRKNKKNKNLTETFSDLVEEFKSSFVVNEEYYSEALRKVKETKFGKAVEDITMEQPCDSRDSSPSSDQDANFSDILEDDEGDMSLVMSQNLISQLQNKFGPIPNPHGNDLIVKLPISIARQIYSYALDSICQQEEDRQNVFDFLNNEDEALARQLQEETTASGGAMSFREIMDHEIALRAHENQQKGSESGSGDTFASKLSRQLLAQRFPGMDITSLQNVLDVTNHSLHEATNLLSLAGHVPVEHPPQEVQKTSRDDEIFYEMTRDESIHQANAYHEAAARFNDMRQLYFQKAKESFNNGNHAVALFYRELYNWYTDRIKVSNSMAAKAMLHGNEGATTLDLHFLYVSEAVRLLDLYLDESIRRLSGRKFEIFIITGRGLHSADGKSKIKPAIKNRLKQRGLKFAEVNPGMLKTVITKTSTVSYNLNGVQ